MTDVQPPDRAPDHAPPRKRHTGRTYVYLAVVRHDGSEFGGRFKIGVSIDPHGRLKGLPEGHRIDLRSSAQRELPTPRRAHQVEKALHKALAPMRMSPGYREQGYTEWFDLAGLATARMLLETLPDSEPAPDLNPLAWPAPQPRIQAQAKPRPRRANRKRRNRRAPGRDDLDLRICAVNQRQLRRVRHLWLRLAWMTPLQVQVEHRDTAARLLLPGFRQGVVPPGHSLRMWAMGSHGVYQLHLPPGAEGLPCALVTRIGYVGAQQQDLEIQFQRHKDLERLPDGPAIVRTLKAALNTVAAMATAREEGWLARRRLGRITPPGADAAVPIVELRGLA